MVTAFFERVGPSTFRPTEHTIGPWDATSQHAGPPSALLGHHIELAGGGENKSVARLTLDILKPIPIEPLEVKVEIVRAGRRVDLVRAALVAGESVVMTAEAWRIRDAAIEVPVPLPVSTAPPPEEGIAAPTFPPPTDPNYLTSMEWRFIKGSFLGFGPAAAWMKMKVPLIEGEPVGGLAHLLAAADSASGISAEMHPKEWLFLNLDLTLHLFRRPQAGWILVDAVTTLGDEGKGLARSEVSDERGPVGVTAQSLFVEPRRA